MNKHLCNEKNYKLNEELTKEYLSNMERNCLKAIKIFRGNNIEKRNNANKTTMRFYY